MTSCETVSVASPPALRLPMSPLLALATAVFITSLSETLPAGLLTGMSQDLRVGDSAAGQTITIYAIGTVLTAVPLSAATARWRRKPLLLTAMAGFLLANTVTALAPSFPAIMAARFLAGVAAGVAWSLLAGYARRLAPRELSGRAIAVAMTGVPIALSLGVPAGTFLGDLLDWRAAFGAMSLLTLGAIGWIIVSVADFPGAARTETATMPADVRPMSMLATVRVPGVRAVLSVTLIFVLAHTVMYAYVDTYLEAAAMAGRTDRALLAFGLASLAGVWIVGRHIDHDLRSLTIASIALVAAAMVVLGITGTPLAVYAAAVAWGLGWGGAPTLLQTAGVATAGRHGDAAADAAQSMIVTLWNLAMALGGTVGGILLALGGTTALPVTTALLSIPALVVVAARHDGFGAAGR